MKSKVTGSAFREYVATFNETNATSDGVKKVDETLFLHLYETKEEKLTLDAFHYTMF